MRTRAPAERSRGGHAGQHLRQVEQPGHHDGVGEEVDPHHGEGGAERREGALQRHRPGRQGQGVWIRGRTHDPPELLHHGEADGQGDDDEQVAEAVSVDAERGRCLGIPQPPQRHHEAEQREQAGHEGGRRRAHQRVVEGAVEQRCHRGDDHRADVGQAHALVHGVALAGEGPVDGPQHGCRHPGPGEQVEVSQGAQPRQQGQREAGVGHGHRRGEGEEGLTGRVVSVADEGLCREAHHHDGHDEVEQRDHGSSQRSSSRRSAGICTLATWVGPPLPPGSVQEALRTGVGGEERLDPCDVAPGGGEGADDELGVVLPGVDEVHHPAHGPPQPRAGRPSRAQEHDVEPIAVRGPASRDGSVVERRGQGADEVDGPIREALHEGEAGHLHLHVDLDGSLVDVGGVGFGGRRGLRHGSFVPDDGIYAVERYVRPPDAVPGGPVFSQISSSVLVALLLVSCKGDEGSVDPKHDGTPTDETSDTGDGTDTDTSGDDTGPTDPGDLVAATLVEEGVRTCPDSTRRNEAYFDRGTSQTPPNSDLWIWAGGEMAGDFDGDGWLDVMTPNELGVELYVGSSNGFTSVGQQVLGAFDLSFGTGGAVADYDGDGDLDVYVTRFRGDPGPDLPGMGKNRLLQNNGDGSWTDVTDLAGVDGCGFDPNTGTTGCYRSMSSSWGDMDGDGDLDLFVGNYGWVDESGVPQDEFLPAEPSFLYRNDGDGTFTDVSERLPQKFRDGYTYAGGFFDIDDDGHLDLYIVNDFGNKWPNHVILGVGDGTFVDDEPTNSTGLIAPTTAMGLGVGDYNADGLMDFAVPKWNGNHLWLSNELIGWVDYSETSGLHGRFAPEGGLGCGSRRHEQRRPARHRAAVRPRRQREPGVEQPTAAARCPVPERGHGGAALLPGRGAGLGHLRPWREPRCRRRRLRSRRLPRHRQAQPRRSQRRLHLALRGCGVAAGAPAAAGHPQPRRCGGQGHRGSRRASPGPLAVLGRWWLRRREPARAALRPGRRDDGRQDHRALARRRDEHRGGRRGLSGGDHHPRRVRPVARGL